MVGRLGSLEAWKPGSWEAGRLGGMEARKLGGWMLDAGCKKAHGSRRTAQGGWLLDTGPNELIDNAVFFNPKSAISQIERLD
jgi:hypothetical protein